MPRLIKGAELNAAQRAQVLAAFVYRWTHENPNRIKAWDNVRGYPTIPLQHDAEWLAGHAFRFINDGSRLTLKRQYAEPVYP